MDSTNSHSQTSEASPSQPQTPTTGGGANGDNSTNNGDKPIAVLPSSAIVQQQQAQEALKIQEAQSAFAAVDNANGQSLAQPSTAQSSTTTSASGDSAGSGTQIPTVATQQETHSDPLQEMRENIAKSPIPDELRNILKERIDRLELIRSGSGYTSSAYIMEYEAMQRYVNWVLGLPWNAMSQDLLDLKKAKEILDSHHFGLEMLKNRMLEYIASIMLNIQNNGPEFATRSPVLCFVGLAGTGKTTFAISMAEALGRKFERIPFGGMADSRVLRGQSRFFPDAEPGQIIKRMVHAETQNPIILLDELDRVTETARADIMGVLIELLDPEQNNAFTDHYIDYPFNLSKCVFTATANNVSSVSTAVLDRIEIIQMPSYNDVEKMHIGRDFVFPKVSKLIGLKPEQLVIDEDVWEIIIRPLGYDPGIRGLDRLINMMCRKAARMIISGQAKNIKITPDNVKLFTSEV